MNFKKEGEMAQYSLLVHPEKKKNSFKRNLLIILYNLF